MVLLKERYAEVKKELVLCHYNLAWIKSGGLILWNATAIWWRFKTSWQMGKYRMKGVLENFLKDRTFRSGQWLNIIRFLSPKIGPVSQVRWIWNWNSSTIHVEERIFHPGGKALRGWSLARTRRASRRRWDGEFYKRWRDDNNLEEANASKHQEQSSIPMDPLSQAFIPIDQR